MIHYEKVTPPSHPVESDWACFKCSYRYPLSNYTHDQSGFPCNQCSDFLDRYVFSPGETNVVEVDDEKYRVWYVDVNIDEVYKKIGDES